jgi:hypothetical protein
VLRKTSFRKMKAFILTYRPQLECDALGSQSLVICCGNSGRRKSSYLFLKSSLLQIRIDFVLLFKVTFQITFLEQNYISEFLDYYNKSFIHENHFT